MEDLYVHQLSPFLIRFTDNIGIRWYGLSYLVGFALAYVTVLYMAKKKTILLQPEQVGDLIMYAALGTIIGGRLGYCLFYGPHLFFSFSESFPFWGVLEVHKGGMASHGGIIGIITAAFMYGKKIKVPGMHTLDLTVLGGTLGVGFGRIANFINGELYGREAPAGTWWAVKFPQEIFSWGVSDKEKLRGLASAVEALGEVRASSGQLIQANRDQWLSWVSTYDIWAQRMMSEFKDLLVQATQSGNQMVVTAIAPALTPRYPSQLIQSALEGFLVFILLSLLWLKPRRPGFISACFGIFYAIARIIGEQFRLPDAHIGYELLGLTRGQWLSVFMLVIMLGYLIYVLKKPATPLGGWGFSKSSRQN